MKTCSPELHDWIIIGGGLHGTHIAIRLLDHYRDQSLSLRIIDPETELMEKWKRQTTATTMKFLRSPAVHNLATDPFGLMKFGGKKARRRGDKFAYPYNRPKLSWFNKHCNSLVEKLKSNTEAITIKNINVTINFCLFIQ